MHWMNPKKDLPNKHERVLLSVDGETIIGSMYDECDGYWFADENDYPLDCEVQAWAYLPIFDKEKENFKPYIVPRCI
ncbi:hypothetical protein YTPLAS21_19200 [Candidatus Nitrosocosmicus sp.]|nr:hypothetical protein YTPLAS21_19200 [Candidatus Nitrosocosmicus sp.]